jgi:peptidoglycan L-alanyl-D-glutamate endopeptidase CwlK
MQRAQAHREADVSDLLIESLHLDLQPKARMHRLRAHAMGLDVVFTAGFRTWAEQVALYEKGRQRSPDGWRVVDPSKVVTNALPEQAPHCRRAAYDLVPIVAERAAWDRLDLFAELGRIGKELGLVWGGDWPKLKDCPHFELPYWRSLPLPNAPMGVA